MPTIIKTRGRVRTYACANIYDLFHHIQSGTFVGERNVPMLRLAADYRKKNGQEVLIQFCGVVVMSICHLAGEEETGMVMERARMIPHTHLAWRSEDKRSVYLACRLEWNEDANPKTAERMEAYLQNGYQLMHYVYSAQLVMHIDTEQARLDGEVPCCYDSEAYFNPNSLPFFVDDTKLKMPRLNVPEPQKGVRLIPGMDEHQSQSFIFHNCHRKALLQARTNVRDELSWRERTLDLLAKYCYESGLPVGYACSHAKLVLNSPAHEVDVVFNNAYAKELLKDQPFCHIEKSALLTLQTEAFLNAFYQLRRNTLTGEVQYRERSAYVFDYRPLTDQVLNSMTIRALKMGIGSWDKDVRRLMNSNDIELFDPMSDYLAALPRWDGKDRVAELVSRIPCEWDRLGHFLHIWLLSMVAHWLGKDALHGNAIVPLFIGDQGCGKTTLASILLPPELRTYYNDKVDFRGESDLMTGLSRFALINIDEFDSLKKSQQPTLKYLLSKSEVKFRPAYGKTIEQRRRYASFLGTTNLSHPLVDRTGSRRFLCIQITSGQRIDTYTPIPYEQLYAQLLAEIRKGERYWLDEEETTEVQQHNAKYVRVTNFSEILDTILEKPLNDEEGEWHSIDDIINNISNNFRYIAVTNTTHRDIGKLLAEKGYPYKRSNAGAKYMVKFRITV